MHMIHIQMQNVICIMSSLTLICGEELSAFHHRISNKSLQIIKDKLNVF